MYIWYSFAKRKKYKISCFCFSSDASILFSESCIYIKKAATTSLACMCVNTIYDSAVSLW